MGCLGWILSEIRVDEVVLWSFEISGRGEMLSFIDSTERNIEIILGDFGVEIGG